MRKTGFGAIARLELHAPLGAVCEVIRFERCGKYHAHEHTDEIAIAVSGSGCVVIEGKRYPIEAGQFIRINAGDRHYMIPSDGETLSMLVGYSMDDLP